MTGPARKPLDGVRIYSVEQYGAGPFGTQFFADLGARVVKIENRKSGGDYAREVGPYFVTEEDGGRQSLFFHSLNRNKHSLTLDLGHPDARMVLARLASKADAVVNNLRGDVPERLGLDYASLKEANPAVVCGHCSAYGRKGDRKSWPGFDFLMQAETGYFYLSGEPGSDPCRVGLSVVDFMAGQQLALGVTAAIGAARETGIGRDIDVCLFDTALYNFSYLAAWALNSGYVPRRVARSGHASLVPCQTFQTSDGWIYIMCNKERFWGSLCRAIDRPGLAEDPKYSDAESRRINKENLIRILDDCFIREPSDHWLAKFAGTVPASPVCRPEEALASAAVSGRLQSLQFPGGGAFKTLRAPISCGGSPEDDHPCSGLGADTETELQHAGFSPEEICELRRSEVI